MKDALIAIGIVVFILFMLWVAWVIYSRIIARNVMRDGRNKKNFTFNYLSTRFSRRNTLKDVHLLITSPSARNGKYIADIGTVFVNRGGIIVLETVPGSGFVEVVERGEWNRIINDKYYVFDDPFLKNAQRVKNVKTFLRSVGVENIPVHNIVVFSGKRVKFSKRLNGLITADELTALMKDLNKDRFLSRSEIRDVVKLIKKNRP